MIELLQRSARPLVCLGLLTASTLSFGAVAAPQVTQPVNSQQRVTLKGNVRPMPRRALDLGAVQGTLPAARVLLLLKRPAAQEAQLEQYIADAHTPGTASYHHWLTPAQVGSQFGPADSDVQAVVAWLQSRGFAVGEVSPAKTTIEFSGTAGQVESAFATKIHSFQIDGVTHVSNTTDPQIPAALAPVIAGISPLNDFRPKPLHTAPQGRAATPSPTSANPKALAIQARPQSGVEQPSLTYTSNGVNSYFLTPADFATIYNTPNSTLNKNYAANASLTGTGVTIGIAGDSNVTLSNVTNYRSLFGLPALTPTVTVDGSDPGVQADDSVEALLDLEVASAVAPGANLTLYISQDTTFQSGLYLAIQRALNDNLVNILNVSFGGCEAYQGQAGNLEILNFWQQAAAQGISVTVSTGDSGAAGCDDSNTEASAAFGLQANGIATTPYNIAVGGTDFNQNSTSEPQYWSTTNSAIGGSALGPIPEIPWNNSTTSIGSLASNVPNTASGGTEIDGAGGGVSSCTTSDVDSNGNILGCSASYAKPSWQSSFGAQNAREVPDVSLFAANGLHDSAWVLCASGLGADQASDTDCTKDSQGSFNFQVVGGTSASSPAFAGTLALVVQQLQSGGATNVRLGQADYTLYPLSKQHPTAFHDVITGNISVVCASGSPDCGANGFLTGYDAAAGYDVASGLGSVDVTQLVQNWSNIGFKTTATTLMLNGGTAPITITHGTSVNVAASVTGSGGVPTGDIVLVNSGSPAVAAVQGTQPSPAVFALSNGTASGTDAFLPGGSYTVKANYNGDGTFGSSVSNGISVKVNAEPSTLELVVNEFPIAANGQGQSPVGPVPYGTDISVYAQPVSTVQANLPQQPSYLGQATGSVTFTSTSSLLSQVVPINSNGFAEIKGQTNLAYPPGTYTVSASYPGDPSFGASTAAAQTFTITKGSTAISALNGSVAGTIVVEVDPTNSTYYFNNGTAYPVGAISITNSSGASVGTGTLGQGTNSQGFTAALVTITLDATKLTSGSNVLSINYSGDTNYNPSGPASFTYTPGGGGSPSFTLGASPTTVTVPSGGSSNTTVSVTPQAGFTGAVNLSCVVSGASPTPNCAFAQPSVTVAGGSAVTDTLTITAASSSSAVHVASSQYSGSWYAAGGAALAGILLIGLPGRRRAWQRMLSLMLFVVALGVVGCGGGSSSGGGGGGTPAGNYSVVVTATSGAITQTSTVMVTVQ